LNSRTNSYSWIYSDCYGIYLIDCDITQTLVDEYYAEQLLTVNTTVKYQFAIDTGMNRIGLDADDPDACEYIIRSYYEKLHLTGLFTHLCTADTNNAESVAFAEQQLKKFGTVVYRVLGLNLPNIHCLNSAGGLWHKFACSVFVRLGIILYSLKPDYSSIFPDYIEPALSWKSVVTMLKTVHAGETVGYSRTYMADHDLIVATVSAGYADG